jgi:hypothetical protein
MTPAEQFVSKQGWEYYTEGDEIHVTLCPFCGHEDVFNMNVETGQWQCWRANNCGKRGNLITLAHARPLPGEPVTPSKPSRVESGEPEPLPTAEEIEKWQEALSDDFEFQNWLEDEKGISYLTAKSLLIGLTTRWFRDQKAKSKLKALAFPYYVDGKLVTMRYRNLTGDGSKFSFTAGRHLSVFNVDSIRAGKPVIVCEGETDALCLLSSNRQNRALSVVGIPGAKSAKSEWRRFFAPASERFIVFDNDMAGQDGAKHFASKYPGLSFDQLTLPQKYKDVSEWLLDPDSEYRDFDQFCKSFSIAQ